MNSENLQQFVMPEVLVSHFHLRSGDKVGDFGAGNGNFSKVLSKAVGAEGKVYALEIQKALVESLVTKIQNERLGNVEVIWGDLEESGGTKIADSTLDAAVMVNCLFQVENKAVALAEIHRTLRSGGKLFIVDWSESFGGMGPQVGHVVDEAEARAAAETAGFVFERTFPSGSHHYGLALRKG